MSWKRARSTDQKAIRRQEILDAAAELLDGSAPDQVSLNAIARKAGIAKSNVYRYFGSREEVFLTLLDADLDAWSEELCGILMAPDGPRQPVQIGRLIASTLVVRPRMTALLAQLNSVMERNVSVDFLAAFKLGLVGKLPRVAMAMGAALPGLGAEGSLAFIRHLFPLIAGLWPLQNPPDAVCEVYERHPELAALHWDFEDSLADAAACLLEGLVGRTEAP